MLPTPDQYKRIQELIEALNLDECRSFSLCIEDTGQLTYEDECVYISSYTADDFIQEAERELFERDAPEPDTKPLPYEQLRLDGF